MSEWQSIDTAPKEGTFLAYNPMCGVFQTARTKDGREFHMRIWGTYGNGEAWGDWYPAPTAWRPMPDEPPEELRHHPYLKPLKRASNG